MGAYFATSDDLSRAAAARKHQAASVADICLRRGVHTTTYYLRLQKLCEGLATLLAQQTKRGGIKLGVQRGCVLDGAPTAALQGPLRSWLSAFVQRHEQGRLTAAEREILQGVVATGSGDREREVLLTPLRERLTTPSAL